MTCDFTGCKRPAKWLARKLWGRGGELRCCDEHRPDSARRPASLRHLPFFYEVRPVGEKS